MWMMLLLGALVGLIAVDGRSLWIDEFGTWLISQQPDLASWWSNFLAVESSDGQLPLYHFYIFYWQSLFGSSEFALHAANLPWLLLLLWAVMQAPLGRGLAWRWVLLVLAHAFVWYYLNEARPYLMMLAAGALLTASFLILVDVAKSGSPHVARKGVAFFFGAAMLVIGSSILGALWVASTFLAICWILRDRINILLRAALSVWWWCLICCLAGAFCFGVAFASFLDGDRAAQMGFSVLGVGYGVIEVVGMAGLGPGRNDLRAGLNGIALADIVIMAGASVLAIAVVIRSILTIPEKIRWPAVLAVLAPLAVLAGLGEALGMRIIGRHFSVLVLPVTLAYAAATGALDARLGFRNIALVVLLLCLSTSSFFVKVSEAHRKEDYRQAASVAAAQMQSGAVVWWAADYRGAVYYKLVPADLKKLPDRAWRRATGKLPKPDVPAPWIVLFPGKRVLDDETLPPADVIIYSRPGSYDQQLGIRDYVRKSGLVPAAKFNGFVIFRR